MELWDLLDAQKNPTGKLHQRGEPVPEGMYHLVVDIVTINPRGEMLATLRDPIKHYGNQWEFTGGSVLAGETTLIAAARELREETGLIAAPEELKLLRTHAHTGHASIFDEYLYRCPEDRPALTLQAGETVDARWVTRAEFERMIAAGEVCTPIVERYALIQDQLPY